MKPKQKGVTHFLRSFGHAWAGLKLLLFNERNFTVQFIIGLLVLFAGFYFHVSRFEWLIIIISIVTVLALEIVNSSIETLADAITMEENQRIKRAKDMAAGAVLLAAIGATIIGIIIFLPKIVDLL